MWNNLFINLDLYDTKVVVCLNAELTTKQPDLLAREQVAWEVFANDLKEVIDSTSASFAFLPLATGMPYDDRVPNAYVAHKCKWFRKNAVVWQAWDEASKLEFIRGANALVSLRPEGLELAKVAGIPSLDLSKHYRAYPIERIPFSFQRPKTLQEELNEILQ